MIEPTTINIEPNWEGMRKWVLHVHRTDPETARAIAEAMGSEAPELPDAVAKAPFGERRDDRLYLTPPGRRTND